MARRVGRVVDPCTCTPGHVAYVTGPTTATALSSTVLVISFQRTSISIRQKRDTALYGSKKQNLGMDLYCKWLWFSGDPVRLFARHHGELGQPNDDWKKKLLCFISGTSISSCEHGWIPGGFVRVRHSVSRSVNQSIYQPINPVQMYVGHVVNSPSIYIRTMRMATQLPWD